MKITSFVIASLASLAISASVRAHHGQSFIVVEDTQCACCDKVILLSNFEWEKGAEGSEFGFSPAVFVGINSRLSLSLEADFRDEVESDWAYSSVTPSAHFLLSPPDCSFPVKFGVSAGYQFGQGEEFEDGPSIHAHGVDAFVGRFIVDAKLSDSTTGVFNLLCIAGPETAWGYAAGLRQRVCDKFSVGVEGIGDFKKQGWQELAAGFYFEPTKTITLKLGAGFGLNDTTPDFTLRTGLIYRF
jgi:hypothetical protein